MSGEEFNKLWEFDDGQEVCIKHSIKGKKYLRVDGDDLEGIDWDGKRGGPKAIWKAHVDGDIVRFESVKTGKFLKIEKDGHGWKSSGKEDGNLTKFVLEKYGKGSAILKVKKDFDDDTTRCIGSKNGEPRPVRILTRGERQEFSVPFEKKGVDKRIVIIQRSKDCNQLRVKKEDVIINKEGGTGPFARWKLIKDDDGFRFKSEKTGEFLRIKKDGDVDASGGKEGKLTLFEIKEIFDGLDHHVHIKSVEHDRFIGVNDEGKVRGFKEKSDKTRLALFQDEPAEDDD